MSKLHLIVNVVFLVYSIERIASIPIIESEIDDANLVIPCAIDRTQWAFPSILQWYRSQDNYSKPIASQFDNYPVHIDDNYRSRYTLLSNGSLNVEHVQLNDNDTFECRLILIDRGLLDIKEKYFVIHRVNERPRLINQSAPLQIASHYSTVNLICQVYGVPVPTVTWYRILDQNKKTADGENLDLISINTDILTLRNVDDRMAGKYRCSAMNRLGSVQSEFQLLIRGSIYWRRFPESQTVRINQSLTLTCEGESSETLQYHWLKDDLPIAESILSQGRIRTYSDGILSLNSAEPTDHGSYVCIISTLSSASVRSRPAVITVKYPPTPSRTRQTQNLTLIRGSPGLCPCLLDAYPPIESVSWYRNGQAIRIEPKGGLYSINSEYTLVIKSVAITDNGEYFCRAQNSEGFGQASLPFYVNTKEPIKFVLQPNSVYHVNERDQLILPCLAQGNPQPTITWFKNSVVLNEMRENLTFEHIDKSDHGSYICQAANAHTTTNITTLVIVENTTPQAPYNVQYRQVSNHLHLSWESGYDGGRSQYFVIWYRDVNTKKRYWTQLRVLPNNATEFLLFDLKAKHSYELTIVAENELGLGTFSPILTIQFNETDESSVGQLQYSNQNNVLRPSSPTDLRLSYSGSNLYITWSHPETVDSSISIVYYVIQCRSTILFNNQQSQQSILVHYPARSHVLKDVKQSSYIVQILSYSDRGIYSSPIESQINIRLNSIFAYHGSSQLLILLLTALILLTIASVSLCLCCLSKYYYHRRSYCTDLECDSKWICGCIPRIQYKLGDCSHMKVNRYHASLLKSNDLPTTPLYAPQHRLMSSTPSAPLRSSSPQESITDSTISLAKVTTIPRCRESIASQLPRTASSADHPHGTLSSTFTLPLAEESKMSSFFDTASAGHVSPVPYGEAETRKNGSRLPLEAVPELTELDVANQRYTFDPVFPSTLPHSHRSHSVQPSPMLITFDSSSLKRHP